MEYTQLIDRILAAEHSAKDIAGEVKRREERLEEELEQETIQLRAALETRVAERLSAIRKEAAVSRDSSIRAQEARKAEALERMEHAYARYGDNWVDTLFHRVVDQRP